MKRVWGFALLLVFSLAFLSAGVADVQAAGPDVIIIPDIISVNSPALVKVDPKTTETPMRINWAVFGFGPANQGSFPVVNGKGLCYFSDEDGNATCGPSPFTYIDETKFDVYVVTPSGITNATVEINISMIEISVEDVNRVDNTVYMYFNELGKKDWLRFSIYNEDLGVYRSVHDIEYNNTQGRYVESITLNPGVYYFAFKVNDSGTYGGAMKRIEIPSSDFMTVQTGKEEYWIGEKIEITGTANSGEVSGDIYFPDGTKAAEFTVDVSGQAFSYEFSAQGDWPEGEYEIKTTSPLIKSVKFLITEFFELDPESVSGEVDKSDDFTKTIFIKNVRSNSTNISFSTSGGMRDYYVTLADSDLGPQEETTMSIQIPGVEEDIEGTITLISESGLEVDIPVSVTVTGVIPADCPAGGAGVLDIDSDYLIMSMECLAGETISYDLRITNNGDTELSDFGYVVRDVGYDQSLESLESMGYIDVPALDFSMDAGDTEYMTIEISPTDAGKYQGIITITSGVESAFFLVDLTCFDDISGDLESLAGRLSELPASGDVADSIGYYITEAQDSLMFEHYEMASQHYETAKAKVEVLESGGASQPVDFTWIIIIIIIIVVVVAVLWFLKFKRPQISGPGDEEEDLKGFE